MAGTGYNVADQHRLFVFPADCVDYRRQPEDFSRPIASTTSNRAVGVFFSMQNFSVG
jgi:hypothetical protein